MFTDTVLTVFIVVNVVICAHETTFLLVANLNQSSYLTLLQIDKNLHPRNGGTIYITNHFVRFLGKQLICQFFFKGFLLDFGCFGCSILQYSKTVYQTYYRKNTVVPNAKHFK